MQKLLLFLCVLIAIWYVRRQWQHRDADAQASVRPVEARGGVKSEAVRECCRCGVLVPESEGVVVGGDFYCSPEHAQQTGRGR
jgi:hypothetical protein